MHFQINHTTKYTYSRPVFLEPHVLRLRPRSDRFQHLGRYQIEVRPKPAGSSEGLDADNNGFRQIWFDNLQDHLEIAVTAEVSTCRTNPFEGLLVDDADHLPLQINLHHQPTLRPFLEPFQQNQILHKLVQDLLGETEGKTLDFLSRLTARLHQSIEKVKRSEPGILSPAETLRTKKGACRDLASVFMAACRHAGIPTRFVSGYQQGDPDEAYRELHAWAEVFLPGFGWRGYDPTHGLAVADQHIVLAAAALPQNTAPVTGAFRGTGADSTIEHAITIHTY